MAKQGLSEILPNGLGRYTDVYGDSEVLIIGGWWQGGYSASQVAKEAHHDGKRVWVLWTSPILQSEIVSPEIPFYAEIKNLLNEKVIEYVLCGSDATDIFQQFGGGFKRSYDIVYPLSLREIPKVPVMENHVGIFGPMHSRKNLMNQLYALWSSSNKYVVNTGEVDQVYTDWSRMLGLNSIRHSWMPEEKYYETVAKMDFGLQVSAPSVESFSYVVFDFLMMNRPCFTTVTWAPQDLQCGPDHTSIVQAISKLHQSRKHGMETNYRRFAELIAEENNYRFKQVLDSLK